ncbi:MAG: bifunctional UDP-N-acetylglucosamine diphosphorylase/glucosamine-1-phosphate N-acetyltransferase GlmU [Brevirhabdus sp.]
MTNSLILLAAGQGTRMQSDRPKVLHEVAGAPLLWHAMQSAAMLEPARTVIIAGHGADEVAASAREFDPDITVALQAEQLGTAHAVAQARAALADASGDAYVLYGDTPFISGDTLAAMEGARAYGFDVVVLGFEAADPGRYGRLVVKDGVLEKIVEFKDTTDEERAITLCNSGVVCADSVTLLELIAAVGNDNASGEYYLTDIVEIANARGLRCASVVCDEAETMGVNTRADLARAEAAFQTGKRHEAMENGVTLQAPDTVFFSFDTVLGRDAEIGANVVFGLGVTVESGARIRPFCHLEGCHVSTGATVGPFARLRPGAELGNGSHIGNFVEIKNAQIGEGAKVNHLSYVGDASVGEATNIGAGTITCNYDGVMKHRTKIGARSFIGSNTCLVAPVTVGDDAMTATGTVVTRNVDDGAMAIARTKQDNKPGFALRLMNRLRAAKAVKMKKDG